jgi:hypothetical protein
MTHLDSVCQSGLDFFTRYPREEAEIFLFQLPPPNAECCGDLCRNRVDPVVNTGREQFHYIFNDAKWEDRGWAVNIISTVRSQLLLYMFRQASGCFVTEGGFILGLKYVSVFVAHLSWVNLAMSGQ